MVNGEWGAVEDGELSRMNRQRSVLVGLLAALNLVRDPGDLADLVEDLTGGLAPDSGFDLSETASLAWEARSMPAR